MRRCLLFVLLFLFCSVVAGFATTDRGIGLKPLSPTGGTVDGNQWLLTIGVDSYVEWPRLATAVNDAKAVRDVLLDRYYFDKAHLLELYNADATRKNIIGALRTLAKKVKPEDSVVIFYAGHGHLDSITKAGSWVPVESGMDDGSDWISNQTIKNYLNADAIKAKHMLLVSDSCFAGDFFRGHRGKLPEVTDVVIKKAYQRASRQAITSGGVEPVSDAGFGGNSVFSHFFVEALKQNDNPFLIPSAIFPEVKSGVAQNAEQFPQMGSLHGVGGQDGGEFVFFLKQKNRLKDLTGVTKERQQELERLRKLEEDAKKSKAEEQAEIEKRQAEVEKMDAEIAAMKTRLGTGATTGNDSLQNMLAMVRQKEDQANRLELLRKQRQEEERKRLAEIENLKNEQRQKRIAAFEKELTAYNEIINSPYGKDMAEAAWKSLISNYGVDEIDQGNVDLLKMMVYEGVRSYRELLDKSNDEGDRELLDKLNDGGADFSASHILVFDPNHSGTSLLKAEGLYKRALKGEDFYNLAYKYSDDGKAKKRGGDLGTFRLDQVPEPIAKAILRLRVGEIAGPIKTQGGYHVIKRTK